MGRRMERKYHSHLSVVTLEARDVRPGPERAGVASSPAHASRGSAETQRGRGLRVTTCGRGRSSTPAGPAGHHVVGGGGASAQSFLGGHDRSPEARRPGEPFLPYLT